MSKSPTRKEWDESPEDMRFNIHILLLDDNDRLRKVICDTYKLLINTDEIKRIYEEDEAIALDAAVSEACLLLEDDAKETPA